MRLDILAAVLLFCGCVVYLFVWLRQVERDWREMLRSYLSRRVGKELPGGNEAYDREPGPIQFPKGDMQQPYQYEE